MRWVKAFTIIGAVFVGTIAFLVIDDRDNCKSIGYKMGMESKWGLFGGCQLKFPDTGWERVK